VAKAGAGARERRTLHRIGCRACKSVLPLAAWRDDLRPR